jgi:hypothetical protein
MEKTTALIVIGLVVLAGVLWIGGELHYRV